MLWPQGLGISFHRDNESSLLTKADFQRSFYVHKCEIKMHLCMHDEHLALETTERHWVVGLFICRVFARLYVQKLEESLSLQRQWAHMFFWVTSGGFKKCEYLSYCLLWLTTVLQLCVMVNKQGVIRDVSCCRRSVLILVSTRTHA